MKKVFALAIVAFAVIGFMAAPRFAEALSDDQQNALTMLLRSFGADDSAIRDFQGAVLGATTGPTDDYGTDGTSTSGIYCPKLTTTMQRGARDATTGGQVTELQLFLADYFNLNEEDLATGFFGKLSQSYVVKFQQEKGLPAFGIVGSLTRAKIAEWCGKGQTGTTGPTPTTPAGTSPLPETGGGTSGNPGVTVGTGATDANGLTYTLTMRGGANTSALSFVEGMDIGPFVLTVKNNSVSTQTVTFPNNCWYTYRISDRANGGRVVFDLASIQQCISAASAVSKSFTLKPGDSFFIDINHKFQTAHIPPGDYAMGIALNTRSGSDTVSKLEFKVWGKEPGTSGKLSCAISIDKSSYSFGETINFNYTSTGGATYGTWVRDTSGKDNFYLGGDKLKPAGSGSFIANVIGNPFLTLQVFDAVGNSVLCKVVIPVSGTVSTNTFSVSLDSSSPSYKLVAANTQNVHTGSFKFRTGNDDVYLYKLLVIANKSVPGIQKISVYDGLGDGAPKLGEGYFVGGAATAPVTFTRQILISKNSEKILQVRADVGPIGMAEAVSTSGDFIQLNYGNAWGKSGSTGADVSPSGSAEVGGIRIMKSFPSVSLDSMPVSMLADGRLMRFKVSADARGPVSLGKMVFRLNTSGVSLSNVKLYAFTDSQYSSPNPGQDVDGGIPTNNLGAYIVGPTNPIVIPSGQTRYFELRGSVSSVSSGGSVTTTLLSDPNGITMQSGIVLREKDTNFVWSPNSVTMSQFSNSDWTGGFAVPGLPASGLSFTRTNNTSSQPNTNPVVISSFSISPGTTTPGQAVTLSWSSNLTADDVSVYGGFCYISLLTDQNQQIQVSGGSIPAPSGAVSHVPPMSGTYTLHCSSNAKDGSPFASKAVRVTVLEQTGSVSVNSGTFSVARPTLTGTATGLSSFTLVITGLGDKYADVVFVNGGSWSHAVWTDMPNGTYTATAYDPKGNNLGSGTFTVSLPVVTGGELYAVGVYEAQGSQHNFCYSKPGTVNVNLVQLVGTKKGTPITLSLSAYEPVIWNINVPTGVNLQKVILSGYYVQSPVITGASPLVERYFYNDPANAARGISPAGSFYDEREGADSRFQTIYKWAGQASCLSTSGAVPLASRWYYNAGSDYFYAYQKGDSSYNTLVSRLQSMTGLTLKNFQGAYSGSTFTVTVGTPEY